MIRCLLSIALIDSHQPMVYNFTAKEHTLTKPIPLSQQKRRNSRNVGLVALVDDEDYEWLSQWNWCAVSTQRQNGGYAMRRDNRSGKTILMHRVLLDAPERIEVDHINGNFDSAEEAAQAYDQLATIVYGEHAKTNF